jgi:two-component system OmpR family response regulator
MKKRILLAEDDENFGMVLKDFLEMNDFEVVWKKDGQAAWDAFKLQGFDLCVVDVMMPKLDGFSLAKDIKNNKKKQPIIFLTARSMKDDMLKGYQIGADDYITKPFDSELLLFKIRAVLNRTGDTANGKPTQEVYQLGKYQFHAKFRTLTLGGHERMLSPKEADLLQLLCQYQNDLLPRSVALQKVWRDDSYFTGRSMDVYMAKIRKYLKDDPQIEIVNIHGEGFRMVVPDKMPE